MKINRFGKLNEEYGVNSYYIIKNYVNRTFGDEFYIIEGEGEYTENYDSTDLKSVVQFVMDNEEEYSGRLEIVKITEEILDNSEIEKIKNEIEIENKSKKYNV